MLTVEALKEVCAALGGDTSADVTLNVDALKAIYVALGGDVAEVADLSDIPSVVSKIATVATGGGDGKLRLTESNNVITGYDFTVNIPSDAIGIGDGAFQESKITSVTIPEGVHNIGTKAFYNCGNLSEVILPSTISSISSNAFANCSDLHSVTVLATMWPACGNTAFDGTASDLVIYVPAESVDAYKTHSGWTSYADKIQPIPA